MAATRWIGFEGGASKSGDRIPLGGANTEDASCDLLLFALPGGQGLEVWKKICSEQALNDLPVAILTMQNQEMVRILDFAKDNSYLKQLGQAGSLAEIKNLLRGLKLSTSAKPPIEVAELVIAHFRTGLPAKEEKRHSLYSNSGFSTTWLFGPTAFSHGTTCMRRFGAEVAPSILGWWTSIFVDCE